MDKNEVLKILETAKDKNGEVPMRLVRQAFEKLPEPCEDMISRQAAIESAESCCHVYGDDAGYRIVEELRELPTAQTEQWIPVTERLPEKNGRYWVWADKEYTPDHVDEPCSYKGSTEASFINGRWFGSHIGKNVYAWMPLPAPYKEGEK